MHVIDIGNRCDAYTALMRPNQSKQYCLQLHALVTMITYYMYVCCVPRPDPAPTRVGTTLASSPTPCPIPPSPCHAPLPQDARGIPTSPYLPHLSVHSPIEYTMSYCMLQNETTDTVVMVFVFVVVMVFMFVCCDDVCVCLL